MITELRQRLIDDAAITAIVGAEGVVRWPAPETQAYPFVAIQEVGLEEDRNLSGAQPAYETSSWQIDCYAQTELEAYDLREVVRDRLRTEGKQSWDDPRNPPNTIDVYFVEMQSSVDGFDPIDNAQGEAGTARKTLTYLIKADRSS